VGRKRAGHAIRDVIAERVFERADGREVRAVVGRPREVRKGEWLCEFRVLGVGHSKVYALSGTDSLEALQLALGMMVVQLESYQKEHGLTFMGDSYLALMKPDVEAIMKDITARPDFPLWSHVLDGLEPRFWERS
jgi:hypothetical protein